MNVQNGGGKQGFSPLPSQGSFVALPQEVMRSLLCLNLTQRELVVLLLVARLTYGVRGKAWATLKQADLRVVGIGANHAKAVLTRLLERGLLVKDESEPQYRLGGSGTEEIGDWVERTGLLAKLVRRQLESSPPETSPFGKGGVPLRGGRTFPQVEETTARSGNTSTGMSWRFSRSQGRFLKETTRPIDKER